MVKKPLSLSTWFSTPSSGKSKADSTSAREPSKTTSSTSGFLSSSQSFLSSSRGSRSSVQLDPSRPVLPMRSHQVAQPYPQSSRPTRPLPSAGPSIPTRPYHQQTQPKPFLAVAQPNRAHTVPQLGPVPERRNSLGYRSISGIGQKRAREAELPLREPLREICSPTTESFFRVQPPSSVRDEVWTPQSKLPPEPVAQRRPGSRIGLNDLMSSESSPKRARTAPAQGATDTLSLLACVATRTEEEEAALQGRIAANWLGRQKRIRPANYHYTSSVRRATV